jgi:hypothetical protein
MRPFCQATSGQNLNESLSYIKFNKYIVRTYLYTGNTMHLPGTGTSFKDFIIKIRFPKCVLNINLTLF